jgi:chromosome partitioning protein
MTADSTPVVVMASTKGGVGKTTLAFCLASEVASRLPGGAGGVACIDADPNLTLERAFRIAGSPGVRVFQATGETLLEVLREARQDSALAVIDLEGSANQAMLYACGKADVVLIPAQPSRYDVIEAVKTAGVVRQAADLVGREIPYRVILSRTPVLRQRVAEHSRSQFARAGLGLLEVELVHRTAFQQMTYTGQPPFVTSPDGGAARNVTAIADEVAAMIGLPLGSRHLQEDQGQGEGALAEAQT